MEVMKAWVLHGIKDLRQQNVPIPRPGKHEVLIQVKAVGICSSDIQRVYYTGAYHYPIILGHEFAGVTQDGRHVGVFPLLPCFKCEACQSQRYETCSDYSYIGSRCDGAFAEYVAVPEWNMINLSDNMSFEQAALLEPAAVALHAVKQLDLCSVDTVAVIGNGAIGYLIGKWLRIFGVSSIDVLGRDSRQTRKQYDACVEAAGCADSFERCVDLVKPNGQLVLVGNPDIDFDIGQKLYWKILRKQITAYGSWNSSYPDDWREVLDNAGRLQLDSFISHIYGFDELDKAFEMMHGKKEQHRKVVVRNFMPDHV